MTASSQPPDRRAHRFVMAVWAALSVGLLAYVVRYGSPTPWMDDWELVPVLSHARPVTLRWLWILQNEHRLPFAKLGFLALNAASGGDYRAGMLASVCVLSALTLAAVRVSARIRGRAHYADAAFPLAFLHPGHEQNLLALIQLFFVTACALATLAAAQVAAGRWRTSPRAAALLAGTLLLLPLQGAIGTLFAPALALWALYAAWEIRRSIEPSRRAARWLFGGALAALAVTAAYFVGFVRPPYHAPSPSLAASARGAMQVLAMSLGPFGAATWPVSGLVLAALFAVSWALLGRLVLQADRGERLRALGLAAAAAAALTLLAATGHGRAGLRPDAGLESRYALLGAPMLAAAFFASVLSGGAAGRLVQIGLVSLLGTALLVNLPHGLTYGRARRAQAEELLKDVRAGLSYESLAQRHAAHLYPTPHILARRLRMLHLAGQGPYRGQPRPPNRRPCRAWRPVPLRQLGAHQMDWRDGVGRPAGPQPYVIFGLTDTERLCGVRFTLVYTTTDSKEAPLGLYWARSSEGWFAEERRLTVEVRSDPRPQKVKVWITDDVDLLRLDPHPRGTSLRVVGLELLAAD